MSRKALAFFCTCIPTSVKATGIEYLVFSCTVFSCREFNALCHCNEISLRRRSLFVKLQRLPALISSTTGVALVINDRCPPMNAPTKRSQRAKDPAKYRKEDNASGKVLLFTMNIAHLTALISYLQLRYVFKASVKSDFHVRLAVTNSLPSHRVKASKPSSAHNLPSSNYLSLNDNENLWKPKRQFHG